MFKLRSIAARLILAISLTVAAVDGVCTHEESMLSQGFMIEERVVCQLHLSQFDLRTGEAKTLPLHGPPNPRMYGVLTAITPGCVAFSLPVQRRNRPLLDDSSVFPALQEPARAARPARRGGSSPSGGPRFYVPGTAFEWRHDPIFGLLRGPYQI